MLVSRSKALSKSAEADNNRTQELQAKDLRFLNWSVWIINCSIIFLTALFFIMSGLVLNGCGPGIMDKMGMPGEAYQGDEERNCIAALSGLAASGLAGTLLLEYSVNG
mgnify:CR=1 FL=1